MGIYIKGMEIPTSCFYCPFREKVNPDDYVCMALNKEFEETFSLIVGKRHKDCPLVPVPPHGRLVDADALTESLKSILNDPNCPLFVSATVDQVVDCSPTIIPAEEATP